MKQDCQSHIWAMPLKGELKLVLLAMASEAGEDDISSPGLARLAEMTGLSERTITRAVNRLELSGVITPQTDSLGRGRRRAWKMPARQKVDKLSTFSEGEGEKKVDNLTTFPEKVDNLSTFNEGDAGEKVDNLTTFPIKVDKLTTFTPEKVDNLSTFSSGTPLALIGTNLINITETTNVVSEAASPVKDNSSKPSSKPRRNDDPWFLIFCSAYVAAGLGPGYDYQVQDFVQLARMRRRLAAAKPQPVIVTDDEFTSACQNYFLSDRAAYTLADLATKISTFLRYPVDRYGQPKPVEALCNGTNKPNTINRKETANERAARQTFELITGALATR